MTFGSIRLEHVEEQTSWFRKQDVSFRTHEIQRRNEHVFLSLLFIIFTFFERLMQKIAKSDSTNPASWLLAMYIHTLIPFCAKGHFTSDLFFFLRFYLFLHFFLPSFLSFWWMVKNTRGITLYLTNCSASFYYFKYTGLVNLCSGLWN